MIRYLNPDIPTNAITITPYSRQIHELLYLFDKPKGETKMIKHVSVSDLPQKSQRGSIIPEVQEVFTALPSMKGALAVELSPETIKRLSIVNGKDRNPYRSFASTLKRHFKNEGFDYEVFHSDERKAVFVRRPASVATPAPSTKGGK